MDDSDSGLLVPAQLLAAQESLRADPKIAFSHGACLFKGDTILACGHNHYTLPVAVYDIEQILGSSLTRRMRWNGRATMHAEIDCLSKLNFDSSTIRGSTLVVHGRSKAGNVLCSKPCDNCMHMIYFMGIKDIWYSIKNNGKITYEHLTIKG